MSSTPLPSLLLKQLSAADIHAPNRTLKNDLRWLIALVILLLLYRVVLMALLPLADTTEARYGEIARLTVSNGFWLMPHMDPQTPFFAKPPLATWTSAVSMVLFGINEFAARLPSLLASLATCWIALQFADAMQLRRRWLVLPVLATSPLFFLSAGTVMTDALQMLIVSAALYFAWRALTPAEGHRRSGRGWRIAFWVMIGIGALCKGLATWALIGLPLIAYGLVERRPWQMFKQVFDWAGVLVAACIFVPWYAAAEIYYPGFLNYFIIGEHFSRFLVPGWTGDRYGFAHRQPLGAIWVFWAAGILPWIGVFGGRLMRIVVMRRRPALSLERFLWCATLAPLVFFTFASNIIWTYGLTAILPFSVIAARWLDDLPTSKRRYASFGLAALAAVCVMCAPIIVRNVNANSDRDLVRSFEHTEASGTELIYRTPPAFSSSYYTHGMLRYVPPEVHLNDAQARFEVVDRSQIAHRYAAPDEVLFSGAHRALVEQK
jgi:4-amino-4-deoxy-L-arabinose transferase-like glycosyltransferase